MHKDEKASPSNAQILQSLNNLEVPFDGLAVVVLLRVIQLLSHMLWSA